VTLRTRIELKLTLTPKNPLEAESFHSEVVFSSRQLLTALFHHTNSSLILAGDGFGPVSSQIVEFIKEAHSVYRICATRLTNDPLKACGSGSAYPKQPTLVKLTSYQVSLQGHNLLTPPL
jgi:hypothetical protein